MNHKLIQMNEVVKPERRSLNSEVEFFFVMAKTFIKITGFNPRIMFVVQSYMIKKLDEFHKEGRISDSVYSKSKDDYVLIRKTREIKMLMQVSKRLIKNVEKALVQIDSISDDRKRLVRELELNHILKKYNSSLKEYTEDYEELRKCF